MQIEIQKIIEVEIDDLPLFEPEVNPESVPVEEPEKISVPA